jgi:hypothetical protein
MAKEITYKKARKLNDLLVDERPDMIFLCHRECLKQGILCLSLSDFDTMTGRQILKRFNDHIDSLLDGIANDRPVEIADGQPQLKWSEMSQQWTTAGDVLRCLVAWKRNGKGENRQGELAIRIDDELLTGQEFLRMIETYEGWGMRIEFMHQNRLTNPPETVIQTKGR